MSQQKPVEVFMPPNTLKAKVGGSLPALDEDAIARAERALQTMSHQFQDWLEEEVDGLQAARNEIKDNGAAQDNVSAFHTRAHDLKGQGTTYQFPLVTAVAGSLCRMLEELPKPEALPLPLVDAHVDAIRAIVRGNIKDPEDPVGGALLKELSSHVAELVAAWDKAAGPKNEG